MIDSRPAAEDAPSRRTDELVARILAIPPRVTDIALAGALALLAINVATTGRHPEPLGDTLLLIAGAGAVSMRRRWPLAVLVATVVPYVVTRHTGTGQAPVLVALYTVASLRPQPTALIAAALAAIASVVAVGARGDSATLALGRAAAVLLAAVAGLVIVERRHQRAREGKMRGQIAAADERVRIARELHDVVAHHLSVIVVQANLAAETLKSDDPSSLPRRRSSPRGARRSRTRAVSSACCAPTTNRTSALRNPASPLSMNYSNACAPPASTST